MTNMRARRRAAAGILQKTLCRKRGVGQSQDLSNGWRELFSGAPGNIARLHSRDAQQAYAIVLRAARSKTVGRQVSRSARRASFLRVSNGLLEGVSRRCDIGRYAIAFIYRNMVARPRLHLEARQQSVCDSAVMSSVNQDMERRSFTFPKQVRDDRIRINGCVDGAMSMVTCDYDRVIVFPPDSPQSFDESANHHVGRGDRPMCRLAFVSELMLNRIRHVDLGQNEIRRVLRASQRSCSPDHEMIRGQARNESSARNGVTTGREAEEIEHAGGSQPSIWIFDHARASDAVFGQALK